MEISSNTAIKIIKLSIIGGLFALLAYLFTSMAYHASAGNIEILKRFQAAGTLNLWLEYNFGTISSALNRIAFVLSLLFLSFLGYVCSAFALVLFDLTKQYIKEGVAKK
jgi:hypothetical protein